MRHYFFINPAAGQGKGTERLTREIKAAAEEMQADCRIYLTEAPGDGETAARRTAEALHGAEARFYACGGDGTLNEIINGIYGYDHIAVGCVPIGTGNDMVRVFREAGDFLNIRDQLSGIDVKMDLIRYTGIIDGKLQTRYCANMFNIGFDCNVVELAGRLKEKPLIAGSFAYLLAVLGVFIKKKGVSLHLTEGDKVILDGDVLLCSIANGNYCGGGLHTSPQAEISDGLFDLNLVYDMSRMTFLRLFPSYMKGTHLQLSDAYKYISVSTCTGLSLEPKGKDFLLCTDGEIQRAESVDFEIAPGALRFIVPESHGAGKLSP